MDNTEAVTLSGDVGQLPLCENKLMGIHSMTSLDSDGVGKKKQVDTSLMENGGYVGRIGSKKW